MLTSAERLFTDVCSDTTLYRTFTETLNCDTVARARRSMAQVRAGVWNRTRVVTGDGPVILDLDASLVEIHSENKQGAAPHFKGEYGFHPLLCFADVSHPVECQYGLLQIGGPRTRAAERDGRNRIIKIERC